MPSKEDWIKALLIDLADAKARGDEAMVPLIEAELRHYGHEAAPPAKRAETRPAKVIGKR
jgi:hypothetical protein